MSPIIDLPPDWSEVEAQRRLVDEGEYTVEIAEFRQHTDGRLLAELKIQDEGPFHESIVFDSFSLTADEGKRCLKEFVEAIGVGTPQNTLDLGACEGRRLRVMVAHKMGTDNRTYANVVRRTPA